MLTGAYIVAAASVITEILLVHGSSFIQRLYTRGLGKIPGVYFNTAGSFALSWFTGRLFGATGVTIAMAGAISTGVSMVYFKVEEFIYLKTGHATLGKAWVAFKPTLKEKGEDFWVMAQDLWKVFCWFCRVITFPVRKWRQIREWGERTKVRFSN